MKCSKDQPVSDWIDLLGAILRDVPRLPGALCRNQHELFDSDLPADVADAAAICQTCPARTPCREWSAGLKHNEASGVYAGQLRIWVSHPSQSKKEISA